MKRVLSIKSSNAPENSFAKAREVIVKGANSIEYTTRDGKGVFDINITGNSKDVVSFWLKTKENEIRYVADMHSGSNQWVFQDFDDAHLLGKELTPIELQERAATAAANIAQQRRITRNRVVSIVFGCFPCVKAWHNRRIGVEASIAFPGPEIMEFKIRGARDTLRTVESDKSTMLIDMVDYDSSGVLFKSESKPISKHSHRVVPPIPTFANQLAALAAEQRAQAA